MNTPMFFLFFFLFFFKKWIFKFFNFFVREGENVFLFFVFCFLFVFCLFFVF